MDILFWSGGKDSYLSCYFYKLSFPEREFALLTTFNEENDIIPHQELSLQTIKKQSNYLGLLLYPVPLPRECSNDVYLQRVNKALVKISEKPKQLIFGDRLAPETMNWREENFNTLGFECYFPIQHKSIDELLTVLEREPVEVEICAVQEKFRGHIKTGQRFDADFVRQLRDEIDPMGERGEFHTEVIFTNAFVD